MRFMIIVKATAESERGDMELAPHLSAFVRHGIPDDDTPGDQLVCVANLSPTVHYDHLVGMPAPGRWREVLNTDASAYDGSGVGNLGAVVAQGPPHIAASPQPIPSICAATMYISSGCVSPTFVQ